MIKKSDIELLERFYREGDAEALGEFVERNMDWAMSRAGRISSVDAADAVQDSILRLYDYSPSGGKVANPLGLWNTLIHHSAMDLLRKKAQHKKTLDRFKQERCAENYNEKRDVLMAHIEREIESTASDYRNVLVKRFFAGMSYDEIAAALRVSPGTVASRLHRAVGDIRKRLEKKGIIGPEGMIGG